MMVTEQALILCRIFIGEDDKSHGKPLFETIVDLARKQNVAGVTVLKGILGFGCHKHIKTTRLLELSENLPIVIEMIDTQEAIDRFLPVIEPLIEEGLITKEDIQAKIFRKK